MTGILFDRLKEIHYESGFLTNQRGWKHELRKSCSIKKDIEHGYIKSIREIDQTLLKRVD
jgi:hypothetical protein